MIHLLDNPMTALSELNRVCKDGGMLIIPTYMNKDDKGRTSGFAGAVGKGMGGSFYDAQELLVFYGIGCDFTEFRCCRKVAVSV